MHTHSCLKTLLRRVIRQLCVCAEGLRPYRSHPRWLRHTRQQAALLSLCDGTFGAGGILPHLASSVPPSSPKGPLRGSDSPSSKLRLEEEVPSGLCRSLRDSQPSAEGTLLSRARSSHSFGVFLNLGRFAPVTYGHVRSALRSSERRSLFLVLTTFVHCVLVPLERLDPSRSLVASLLSYEKGLYVLAVLVRSTCPSGRVAFGHGRAAFGLKAGQEPLNSCRAVKMVC